MSSLLSARELADLRSEWNRELTVPCTINRKATDPDGLSTGQTTVAVASTMCSVSTLGGAGNSIFTDTLLQSITTAKTPGARALSFRWDEDVQSGDIVVTARGKYKLGLANSDDPERIGLSVDAEIVRAV